MRQRVPADVRDDYSNRKIGKILLKRDVFVNGNENIETILFHELEQLAIFDAGPSHVTHRKNVMSAAFKGEFEPDVNVFVKQNFHTVGK